MVRKERNWRRWETAGLFAVLILGNLLHFIYDWSGENKATAAFAAVNESTWEHIRLFIIPWVLWTLAEWLGLRGNKLPVLSSRAIGLLVGVLFIPACYYTYRSALGIDNPVVNVALFQAAVLLAFTVTWVAMKKNRLCGIAWQVLGGLVLLAVWVLAVLWTYAPPAYPVFVDPTTGKRGIAAP